MSRDPTTYTPEFEFHSPGYPEHNKARQEHLASLGLPLDGCTVLELGAGIGDHTPFFLERGCVVTAIEGREANCAVMAEATMPWTRVICADLDSENWGIGDEIYDIVYAYGVLYHLGQPDKALARMAKATGTMLLLESCVSQGDGDELNPVEEGVQWSQALHGTGCRPTRSWIFARLKKLFPHVYVPYTQPDLEEFLIDWTVPYDGPLKRSIFIASWEPIQVSPALLDILSPVLLDKQFRFSRSAKLNP